MSRENSVLVEVIEGFLGRSVLQNLFAIIFWTIGNALVTCIAALVLYKFDLLSSTSLAISMVVVIGIEIAVFLALRRKSEGA